MHSLITDNDSTLMQEEILDEIARFAGDSLLQQIEEITNKQMNGESTTPITFQESLEKRVDLLVQYTKEHNTPITKKDLKYIATHSMHFSNHVEELLQNIIASHNSLQSKFFIFSGGFKEIIFFKIEELNISKKEKEILKNQTYANCFSYSTQNEIIGLDIENSQMLSETAKLDKTNFLIQNNLIEFGNTIKIIGLGDGSNDVGMVPDKYGFCVAYTEHVYRENTVKKAKNITAKSFYDVEQYLQN